MILFARAIVRLVSFLLLVVLAAAGLALAVFRIDTGTTGPSLGWLASTLQLPSLRDNVGDWLGRMEASGPIALIAALCGLGAMLLGLLLLAGLLVPRRERLLTLVSDDGGTLAARRRPLAQAAQTLAEQVRGITDARARIRPRRSTGGRLRIRASHPRPADPAQLRSDTTEQLRELTDAFALKTHVDVARRGARVE